ncbi:MAG: type 4a pilus biogenesis protein PilO [Acidobacteria bacterium]|nr:type 4a pilus biogenesis protein PilO [Acidobacteriota bacterium]
MKKQMAIAAVASVLLTAVFYVALLKPKMSAVAETRTQVDAARVEQQTLENKIRKLQAARRNAPAYLARLDRLTRMLPSDPDLPGFIRLVQRAAEDSGVDLKSIAPAQPAEVAGAKGVQMIQVTLAFEAGFRRVQDFLGRLESLDRIVEVRSLTLNPQTDPDTQQTLLDGSLGLQMYVAAESVSPAPRATPAAGSAR